MKTLLLLFTFIVPLALLAQHAKQINVEINSNNPQFPFPQFLDYKEGKTLGRDNAVGVTDIEMERDIREAYQIMMNRCAYKGMSVAGTEYIVFNEAGLGFTGPEPDVTEGDGYALLAAAYMADKPTYDGLFMYIHDHKASRFEMFSQCGVIRNPEYVYGIGTIGWKPGENDAAADGDYDIALAALVAYYQWPEGGIVDDCGNLRTYKHLAIETMKSISDTIFNYDQTDGTPPSDWVCSQYYCPNGPDPRLDPSGAFGYYTGNIGLDGYIKSGNTWAEVTSWNTPQGVFYEFDGKKMKNRPAARGGIKSKHIDYSAPSYFKVFADFLEQEDPEKYKWNIHQFRRVEASCDWLMGEVYNQGLYPTAGNFTVTGSTASFSEMNFAEDSRHPWRTILNHTWHGKPQTTWDPVTHEVVPGENQFELDNALKLAERCRFVDECTKLGNDPTALQFRGVSLMTDEIGLDGGISPGVGKHINYNLGSIAPAITTYHKVNNNEISKKLISDWYRQLVLLWDATDEGYPGPDDRYINSLPKYFHGWFRVLGLLVVSGNYQSPQFMGEDIKANVKVYNSVDKTVAFAPTISNGIQRSKGDVVTYTLTYRNYSSEEAKNLELTFPVPAEYEFIDATGNGALMGGDVVWAIGDLPGYTSQPNETGNEWREFNPFAYNTVDSVQVRFRVKANTENTIVETAATIEGDNLYQSHTSNNYPNWYNTTMMRNSVDISTRSLQIVKRTDRAVLNDGDLVNFDIEFENSSKVGWLNGGRPGVRVTYANGFPGPNTIVNYFRLLHGAAEAYINTGNYRVSYFLNDAARIGVYDPGVNDNGWKMSTTIIEGGDPDKVKFSSQEYTFGQDAIGKWNQRLIVEFPDTLMSITQHTNMFFAKEDEPNDIMFVHKGIAAPYRMAVQMEAVGAPGSGCGSIPMEELIADDWSYTEEVDAGSDDKSLYYPISPGWFDQYSTYDESLFTPINEVHIDACSPIVTKTYDRILVEEWDGYVWRRILGNGPVPGRELMNVCVRDTLPEGLEWQGFSDKTALGVEAEYNPATREISWCVPGMLPGASGTLSYAAIAKTDCSEDIDITSSAWISSDSDSPIDSAVNVLITCDAIPVKVISGSTLYKYVDKENVTLDDEVTYRVEFLQSDGTITDLPELTSTDKWITNCGSPLSDFSSIKNKTITYTYSHGTNGTLRTKVAPREAQPFSLVFRHNSKGADCGDGLELRIVNNTCAQATISLYENGTQVGETKEKIAYAAPVDTMDIRVKLEGDKLYMWINNDNAIPYVFEGITHMEPGYVGFKNASPENHALVSWYTNFDSAFEVNLQDKMPESIEMIAGSETVLYDQNGIYTEPIVHNVTDNELTWELVTGDVPMLFLDSVAFEFKAKVVDCGNGFVANFVYANIKGQPEFGIAAVVNSHCTLDGCTPPTSVTLDPAVDTEMCEGQSIEVGVTVDPAGSYDYELYKDDKIVTGAGNPPYTIEESGVYVVRAVNSLDETCYLDSDPITVTVNPMPSATVDGLVDFCAGTDQSVTVSPASGTLKYVLKGETDTVEVSDPTSFTIADPGVYVFIFTAGENGCYEMIETEIEVFSVPTVEVTPDPAAACSGVDLPLTASAEEGDGTYSFDWTHNGVLSASDVENPIFNSTDEQIHTITCVVEDGNGCSSEKELEVEVTGRPDVSLNPDPTVCKGETVLDLDLSHGLAGDSELKSATAVFTDDGKLDVVNTDVGIHTIEYIFSLSPGCSDDATAEVEVVDAPSITITGPTQLCEGAGTELYTASPDDGAFIDIAGVFTGGTFDPATAGDYILEYEATAANADCKAKGTLEITVHELPEITIDLNPKYCPGQEVELSATPDGGKFHGSAVVDGKLMTDLISAGTVSEVIYTLEETTSPFSCANSASKETEVVVLDPLSASNVTASIPDDIYPPLEASGAVAGAAIVWIPVLDDGTLDTSSEAEGTPYDPGLTIEGVYEYVVVQRLDGCESEPVKVIYTVSNCEAVVPVIANPEEEICAGGTVLPFTTDATDAYWFAEGEVPKDFSSFVDGSQLATTADFTSDATEPGTYVYYVANRGTSPDCFSGTVKATLTINKLPEPVIDGLETQYCHNDGSQTLSLVPAGGTLTVNGSEYTGTDFDPGSDFNVGNNSLDYIFTDDNGCTASSGEYEVTVVKVDQPVIDAKHTWLLEEAPTNQLDASGKDPEWLDSDDNSLSNNPYTPGYDAIGDYVSYVVDNDLGCQSEPFEVTVKVIDCATPVPSVENVTRCAGADPVVLPVTKSDDAAILTWYDSDGLIEEASEFTHDNMVEGDYIYYVTQTYDSDDNGACPSKKAAIEVTITPQPVAELPEDYLEYICESDKMVTLIRNHETGEISEWENADGYIEKSALAYNFIPPAMRVSPELTYRETAIDGGCSDEITIKVNSVFVPQPIVDETGTACPGSTDLVLAVNDAETDVDYIWSLNTDNTAASGEMFEPVRGEYVDGDNTYSVYGTDKASGCLGEEAEGSFNVQKIEKPIVLLSDTELCFGSAPEFETFIPGGGFLIRYYTDEDLTQLEYEGTDAIYMPKAVDAKVHTYYAVLAENCTSEPTEITFEILPEVEVPTVEDSETCEGDEGELVAEASGTIKWYDENDVLQTSAAGRLVISSASETAIYTAVNENSIGCESVGVEATLTVKAEPQPPVVSSDSGKDSKCDTEIAPIYTAAGESGASFHWEMPGETVDAPTMTPVGSGAILVTVTQTVNGCESEPNEFTFTFYDEITPPSNIDYTPCEGELQDITFANLPSGAEAVWRTSSSAAWESADAQVVASGSETYETAFKVSEADGDCYSETASLTISAVSPPAKPVALSDNPLTVCYGNPETMEVEAVDGIDMIWRSETGMELEDNATSYTPIVAELAEGEETTFYVYAVEGECQSTEPLEFVQTMKEALTPPFASAVDVCAGSSSTVRLSALAFGGDIYWYENGEHIATGGEFLAPVPSVIFDETVTYEIRAVEDDCESPSAEADLNVFVDKEIVVQLDEDEICTGTPVNVSTSSGGKFTWSVDGEVVAESAESIVYQFDESGRKTITVADDNHVCLPSGEEYVYVADKPQLDIEAWQVNDDGMMNFKNKSLQEEIEWVGGFVSPEVVYQWDFSSDALPSEAVDEVAPFSIHEVQYDYGLYKIQLSSNTVDYKGCESTLEKEIFVKLSTGLWVPNALTNDPTQREGVREFRVFGHNIEEFEITIYDNFNNIVWYSTALENGKPSEVWTGISIDGTMLKPDVYRWKIEATFKDGKKWKGVKLSNGEYINMGNIILLR